MGTFYVIDDSHRLDQFIISKTREKGKHFQKKLYFHYYYSHINQKKNSHQIFFLLKPCNGVKLFDIIMGYILIGFEAYEQAELYSLAIENILSNAFLSSFIQIFLNDFHSFASNTDAILNDGIVLSIILAKVNDSSKI
jgi:hypothetical protein